MDKKAAANSDVLQQLYKKLQKYTDIGYHKNDCLKVSSKQLLADFF